MVTSAPAANVHAAATAGGVAAANGDASDASSKSASDMQAALLRYGADASLEDRVVFLTDQLAALEHVREWKLAVKCELVKPEYSVEHLERARSLASVDNPLLYGVLEKMGFVSALKRSVLDLHCAASQAVIAATASQTKHDDALFAPEMQNSRGCSLDAVLHARESWEAITRDEMLRFARETGQPLVASAVATLPVAKQSVPSDDAASENASSDQQQQLVKSSKLSAARFLYDGNDLLHALQAIQPANRSASAMARAQDAWAPGSIQLLTHTPALADLRRVFPELSPAHGQIGLDELFASERQAFVAEKNRVGDLVLTHQSPSMARQFAKTGCPTNLRPHIWRQALGVALTPEATQRFHALQQRVMEHTYLTDSMYALDLQQAFDSCDYFVFEDHLASVVMAFTRDEFVFEHALQVNGTVHATVNDSTVVIPPNGVLPFSGLVLYAAPLTYVYDDPVALFFVFRAMYVRYWSKLNAIRSDDPSTILGLCKLFEDLTLRTSAPAVFHLLNNGLRPLDIAFPWLQTAFSGVLAIREVLLLWDRVVGFDALELVAILAAALFHFRADELCNVTTQADVDDVFAELLELQVVPMLQEYLFLLS